MRRLVELMKGTEPTPTPPEIEATTSWYGRKEAPGWRDALEVRIIQFPYQTTSNPDASKAYRIM